MRVFISEQSNITPVGSFTGDGIAWSVCRFKRVGRSGDRIPAGAKPALRPIKCPTQWLERLFAGNKTADA